MPKVSIILTSFNHEKYIREAIDSAVAQTFTDFELIIWDDASGDNSWSIINSYSDPRIKTFRNDETRRGIYGINKAIAEIASGKYIAIHHSDDVWEPEKLEKQVTFLDEHPEFGAVFTHLLAIDEDSNPLNDPEHVYSNVFNQPNRTRHEWLNYFFYHGNALCHPSVLIRKQCYTDCGLYRYGMAQVGDFDMWIRLCLKYEIYILPEKLLCFRVRDNKANASGVRPETVIRMGIEYLTMLKSYLLIETFEEMAAIFPEAKKYYQKDGFEPKFVFAMIALEKNIPNSIKLEKNIPNSIKLFGIELLFDLIYDSTTAKKIKSLYGFDYRTLIALTGKHDVFSIERNRQLVERDRQLVERDRQIAALYNSISWKITRPLRKMGKLFKRGTIGRSSAKYIWYTITLQLPKKLRERKKKKIRDGCKPPKSSAEYVDEIEAVYLRDNSLIRKNSNKK